MTTTRLILLVLTVVGLGVGTGVFSPYVAHYASLWLLHAGSVGPTLVVIAAYAVLLVCSSRARRFVLRILDVVTLGVLGSAIARRVTITSSKARPSTASWRWHDRL